MTIRLRWNSQPQATPTLVLWAGIEALPALRLALPRIEMVEGPDGVVALLPDHQAFSAARQAIGKTRFGTAPLSDGDRRREAVLIAAAAAQRNCCRTESDEAYGADPLTRFLDAPAVHFVYQPIVGLASGKTIGHEVLARPEGISISDLVAAAAVSTRAIELDVLLLRSALDQLRTVKMPGTVTLNLLPATLMDPGFRVADLRDWCQTAGLATHRVTIECTEHQMVADPLALGQCVGELRRAGFGVAVDDAGAGHASFSLIARIRPTTIKVDRSIVTGCDTDNAQQALIQAFVMFARRIGSRLVAEGIETREELVQLRALGVDLGQGYLLGRPAPLPVEAEIPKSLGFSPNRQPAAGVLPRLGSIAVPTAVVRKPPTGEEARERFVAEPSLTTLVFVDSAGRPTATLTRERLFRMLSGPYGYALFGRRSAMEVADLEPDIVRADETIANAAVGATAREYASLYDDLVVVDPSGSVIGVAPVRELLRSLTSVDIEEARQLNPLTGLPGNIRIEQTLTDLLGLEAPLVVSYIDLNNFKAFNDAAGFTAGDRAIQALGRAIVRVAARQNCPFVGHIGGDDFVAVWANETDAIAGALALATEASDSMARSTDLPQGVLLPGITVATLVVGDGEIRDVSLLANRLAALKGHAKRRGRSVHAVAGLANLDRPIWHELAADSPRSQRVPYRGQTALRRHSIMS